MLLVNVNIFLIFDEHLLFSDGNCIGLVEFNILRNLLRYIFDFMFLRVRVILQKPPLLSVAV